MTFPPAGAPSPQRWHEIESTLQRALDVAPAARPAFLDHACAGDQELRREVESLIAADPGTGFLERPVLAEFRAPTGLHNSDLKERRQAAPVPNAPDAREGSGMARRLAAAVADRYAVERELGRGGMAMVFLARDLRHRRHVAIKVLYPELSAVLGPDRFLKEIELTASLQHPHILPLYDSGNADGLLFYVMPFVEGETLRTRLSRERHLPVGDALRIAGEVGDALTYAHARSVIHRDIKPENILLQGDHAVVADFGIALAVQQAGGERMTRTGLSLGTPQYMAPEQAMGDRVVDVRADVYALGAVTYEMLAGEAPFAGPTAQAVVARLLTEAAPPLAGRRPNVPSHVEAAVRLAMERIPADRFPSAAAFAAALSAPAMTQGRIPAAPRPRALTASLQRLTTTRRATVMLVAGALAAVAVAVTPEWLRGRAVAASLGAVGELGITRFAVDADSSVPGIGTPAISPDGRTLVYLGDVPSGVLLFARRLDELAARPLKGTEYGESPFFSPDGASIAYAFKGAIWRLRLEGGTPELVSHLDPSQRFAGGTWGTDDVILYGVEQGGLFRVPASGGEPTRLVAADRTVRMLRPQLLPGMRATLVTVARGNDAGRIGVFELATGRLREFGSGAGVRYAAGHLIFARRGGEIYRQRFDLEALQPTGEAVRIERGVDESASTPVQLAALFDAAPNGTIAYRAVDASSDGEATRLILTDRVGRVLQDIPSRVPWSPRFSPDGRRLAYGAFAAGGNASEVWITDLASGATQQLTSDGRDNNDPRWSPDGKSIAYSAIGDNGKDLFVQSVTGAAARRLTARDGSEWPSGWTNDGAQVLFTQLQDSDQRDVWLQPANGATPRSVVATRAQETGASVSPDGRWVTYQSDESGRPEVYVESFPVPGRKTRVSERGGVNPMWRGDGRELYYWQEDRLLAVMVDDTRSGAPPSLGARTPLFRASYTPGELPMYDVSRDGTRFVLVAHGARVERLVVALGLVDAGPR